MSACCRFTEAGLGLFFFLKERSAKMENDDERNKVKEIDESDKPMDIERLLRLAVGNVGDEVALRNICEAQGENVEELSKKNREFLFHTNSFYYSAEEFMELHEADREYFQSYLDSGHIIKTTDGYVFINCV